MGGVRWTHQKTNTASVAAILRFWMAVNAPPDGEEHYVRSITAGVFRTREDALQAGWHEWQSNWQAGSGGWTGVTMA